MGLACPAQISGVFLQIDKIEAKSRADAQHGGKSLRHSATNASAPILAEKYGRQKRRAIIAQCRTQPHQPPDAALPFDRQRQNEKHNPRL